METANVMLCALTAALAAGVALLAVNVYKTNRLIKTTVIETYDNLENVAKWLKAICEAVNQSNGALNNYINFSIAADKTTLRCFLPFLKYNMEDASEEEDYQSAHEMQILIQMVNDLLKAASDEPKN